MVLILVTAVMSIPDMATILLFATLGLAIPLWFTGTALLYWLCLLPLVLLWKQNRVLGAIASVVACLAAAVLPYESMKNDAARVFEKVAKSNVSSGLTSKSKTIEIVRKSSGKFFKTSRPCGPECRGLLLSGKVNWVRHVDISIKETKTTFFKAVTGDECDVEGMVNKENICILTASDNGEPAGLRIVYEKMKLKDVKTKDHLLEHLEQVSVSEFKDGNRPLVYKQSSPGVLLPLRPTVIAVNGAGIHSFGQTIMQKKRVDNIISLNRTLSDLGYEFENIKGPKVSHKSKDGPDVTLTREMLAVLNLPDDENFSREKAQPINDWTLAARGLKEFKKHHIDLLGRIVKETRYLNAHFINQIYSRNPNVAKELLPIVLDVLENNPHLSQRKYQYTPAHSISYHLYQTDPEILKKYTLRIVELSKRYKSMRNTLGLLDVDPRPYLLPIAYPKDRLKLGSDEQSELHSRIAAVCRSDDKWKSVLLPELQKAAENAPLPTGSGDSYSDPNEYRSRLAKALARYGDIDRAASLYLKGLTAKELKRLKRRATTEYSLARRCR